ncbi:MAG: protease inhibitor I42 family protein [Victivallaceae bacterium]|nr:protease inhibitor I42 family protein [Victivallaceae bacterium]
MRALAFFTALLLFAGCSTAPVVLTEMDSASTITLEKGESFTVSLYANASTGYTWEFLRAPDKRICKIAASRYVPSSTDPYFAGAGGKKQWIFQAVAPGTTMIRLCYRRNWEKNVRPAKVFDLHVEVK